MRALPSSSVPSAGATPAPNASTWASPSAGDMSGQQRRRTIPRGRVRAISADRRSPTSAAVPAITASVTPSL